MTAPVFGNPYPVMLNLSSQRVLVVGGGKVGWRKAEGLLAAGAAVSVVAPAAVAEIRDHPDIRWHDRPYRRGEAASYRLVITATADADVNAQVARDADAANVFVNSADDPQNCSFILPSVLRRGDLQIAISTNGRSPAFAQWLRRSLGQTIVDDHERALEVLSTVRGEVRARWGTSEIDGWADAIDDRLFELVAANDEDGARHHIYAALGLDPDVVPNSTPRSTDPATIDPATIDPATIDPATFKSATINSNGATL